MTEVTHTHRYEVHLHLHQETALDDPLVHLLTDVLVRLRTIEVQEHNILMISEQTKAALARIEAATTDLSARVKAIQDRIVTDMTPEDVASVNAELGAIAGNLEGMAKDPENPIP